MKITTVELNTSEMLELAKHSNISKLFKKQIKGEAEIMQVYNASQKEAHKLHDDINNGSYITIKTSVMEEALEQNIISLVKQTKNAYYAIGDTNNVLMSVDRTSDKGYRKYVLINRTIEFSVKNKIDLVDELSKQSWIILNTGKRREFVVSNSTVAQREAGMPHAIYLSRAIMSIRQNGKIMPLVANHDVHHEYACWDNRTASIQMLPSALHRDRNSHLTPIHITSLDKLIEFIKNI